MIRAACLALAACATAAPAPTVPHEELATTVTLANGIRVVLAPDASLADVVVAVRVPIARGDAAELFARSLDVLEPRLDPIGGWSTQAIDRAQTTFTMSVPAEALERALGWNAARFARLSADAALSRIAEAETARRATDRATLIAGLGPIATTRADLERLLPHYTAGMTIAIVGRFDASVTGVLARSFGALRVDATAPPAPARIWVGPLEPRDLHDDRTTRLTVALSVRDGMTAERVAVDALARVLAAHLAAALIPLEAEVRIDPPFVIEVTLGAPADEPVARNAVLATLRDRVARGVDDDELGRAKQMIDLDHVLALESGAYRASALLEALAAERADGLRAYHELLADLTSASLAARVRAGLIDGLAIVSGGAR